MDKNSVKIIAIILKWSVRLIQETIFDKKLYITKIYPFNTLEYI